MKKVTFLIILMLISSYAIADVYVMRHGDYAGKDKALTEKGKTQILNMLKQIKLKKIDTIMYSSIKRTTESATVIKKYYKGKVGFEEKKELNYELTKPEKINDLIKEVMTNQKGKIVFMVTHSPKIKKVIEHYKMKIKEIKEAEIIHLSHDGKEIKAAYIKLIDKKK